MIKEVIARNVKQTPEQLAGLLFGARLPQGRHIDALYMDSSFSSIVAISGLPFRAPVVIELLKNPDILADILTIADKSHSVLVDFDGEKAVWRLIREDGAAFDLSPASREAVSAIVGESAQWAGCLNQAGEHEIDLRTPSPGPHFSVNLLIGNRIGFPHALQTTPKSVVDRLGGGSFRSHAATQVLATRWDMRQEENGHPANRQFYIIEGNQQVFYSANPLDANIIEARCIHSQNHTRIIYRTRCGLEIQRLIFILPQRQGMPIAVEAQRIEVINHTARDRHLRLVYTGMFGNFMPVYQMEDILFTNIIMQSRLLLNADGSVLAIGPDYSTLEYKSDQWFHVMLARIDGKTTFPTEFCMNYNEFIGAGTLHCPQNLTRLTNRPCRKGPGFFAVGIDLDIAPENKNTIDNFTGLISDKDNPDYQYAETYRDEIKSLVEFYAQAGELEKVFSDNRRFIGQFSSYMQLNSSSREMNVYFNQNLPFQIFYQTFASRSFCLTQKGYREIGFREIQDLYASMYYFAAMGKAYFIKQLLLEWCSKIFEFGFAYHNFYWVGKEPGKWSDDSLWFVQAVYRYVNLTGDIAFLKESCEIAGSSGRKRPVFATIKAILRYSAQISIGKHGFPLIDHADWNDCLKIDPDFIDGITKEKIYQEQVKKSGQDSEPLKNDYSESIMNAFLLKLALDQASELAGAIGVSADQQQLAMTAKDLCNRLQKFAWKEDYFTRVLINRDTPGKYTYIGARGDGFSGDPQIDGVFFLNSFSWAVLSGTAHDAQILVMLSVIENHLLTPFGLKLVSPVDLSPITKVSASEEYFTGDRENGGVFKHACMMATSAMFKAAKEVRDSELARRLAKMAYWMADLVLPFRTMENPYEICGNPRFCTQYNNSETGENIGPMLSGTATWLFLTLMSAYGFEYSIHGIRLDPILREDETSLSYTLSTGQADYAVTIEKKIGFRRIKDHRAHITLDGIIMDSPVIPILTDGKTHKVDIKFIQ